MEWQNLLQIKCSGEKYIARIEFLIKILFVIFKFFFYN